MLVANLYDFDPADETVPLARMEEIDRWLLARYAECAARIVKAWDDYDYPTVFQTANQFITVDVSAFYVDVTKDRMYTFGASSEARRSGQTAMFVVVDGLARLLAPILSVTMDELWRGLPGPREASVHMALFPRDLGRLRRSGAGRRAGPSSARCATRVNLALEQKRQEKAIGGNLSAAVEVAASGAEADLLRQLRVVPADALRRVGGDAARRGCRRRPRGDGVARRRREVRSLLARRARGEQRARIARGCVRAASRRWPKR